MSRYSRWTDNYDPVTPEEHRALKQEALVIWSVLLILAACVYAKPFLVWLKGVLRWQM